MDATCDGLLLVLCIKAGVPHLVVLSNAVVGPNTRGGGVWTVRWRVIFLLLVGLHVQLRWRARARLATVPHKEIPCGPGTLESSAPRALAARHLAGAAHALPHSDDSNATEERAYRGWHQHRSVQQSHVRVSGVDAGYHAQLPVHRREHRGQAKVHQEEVDVHDRVAESAPRLQLRPVVPLGPVAAIVLEEKATPSPQVLEEVAALELVWVEDEGRVEPGGNRQADGRPGPSELGSVEAGLRHAAHGQDEQGTQEEQQTVVVAVHAVVQVEAADLFELQATLCGLPDEGPPLCREAAAGADVGGAPIADLVHHVVAYDLGLEDEEQGGEREHLLRELHHGRLEPALHPDLGQERQRGGHEEEEHQPGEPDGQGLGHDRRRRPPLELAALEAVEAALAVGDQGQQPDEGEQVHAPGDEELREVVAHVGVVEGQGLGQMQRLAQAEDLAGDDLLARARGKLREEAQHGVEAQVPALGQVEVLAVADPAALTAQREVHARKDVLREVQRLRGLGHPALLHHVELVHHVRMAVVHPGAQGGVAALEDGAEGCLRRGRKVAHGADGAGDVLGEADDALGQAVPPSVRAELPQGAWQEHHLLEIGALVCIDALTEGAPHEWNGVVLVVALPVPQDRVAGQFHAEPWLPAALI
mmetsp:Transcript_42684/g.132213  ORF Transcript_42684/g.132213 Transcript_42684/m.132213 type:complete len:646 (-) Transcript_42684:825-2762(-)